MRRMSSTTPVRSRPATLADTTSLRETFSRLMVFGPVVDTMSATYDSGTACPSALTRMSPRSSAVVRLSALAFSTRLKERLPSKTVETVCPARSVLTVSPNSARVMPYFASMSRRGTICSCGRSTCCSTFRSAMPSTPAILCRICCPRA